MGTHEQRFLCWCATIARWGRGGGCECRHRTRIHKREACAPWPHSPLCLLASPPPHPPLTPRHPYSPSPTVQVKDFVISGVACSVDIALESIDEKPVRPGQLDAPLWFGEVIPGSGFTKRLTMRNTTTLPFPFKWHQATYPQTRPARSANDTTGPLALGAALGTTGGGAGATGGMGGMGGTLGRSDVSGVPEGGLDATRGPLPGSGGYGKVGEGEGEREGG